MRGGILRGAIHYRSGEVIRGEEQDPAVRPNPRNDIWCGNKARYLVGPNGIVGSFE